MPYRPMYVLAGNGVSDASPDMLTRCNEARWPPSPEATTMGDACLGSALEKKKALLWAKTAFANKGRESYPLDIFAKKQGRFGASCALAANRAERLGVEGRGALTKYAVSRHGAHQSVSSTQRHMEEDIVLLS